MKQLEVINYISITVIAISLFFIGTELTGFATTNDTGVVNVTIETLAALDFTTSLLDFGSGAVSGGAPGATLSSVGAGSVTDGTWSTQSGQLVLENIGNVNVTLNLTSNKTVDNFIGGTSPTFKAVITEVEAGSCNGTQSFETLNNINTTQQIACDILGYADAADSINIDFEIYIPNNALGAKTVGIVAIGEYTP